MIENKIPDRKVLGRLDTVAILLLIVAIPLLHMDRLAEDALRLIALAALLAFLSMLVGLTLSRRDFCRRAALFGLCLLVLYLAGSLVLRGRNMLDIAPPFLRDAISP